MNAEQQRDFWPSNAEACARRDDGIGRATLHAERTSPEWNAKADDALRVYLDEINGRNFLAEEFVAWARVCPGLPMPPDGRAWGGVIRRAACGHRIEKAGAAPANTSNRSLKPLWHAARQAP